MLVLVETAAMDSMPHQTRPTVWFVTSCSSFFASLEFIMEITQTSGTLVRAVHISCVFSRPPCSEEGTPLLVIWFFYAVGFDFPFLLKIEYGKYTSNVDYLFPLLRTESLCM